MDLPKNIHTITDSQAEALCGQLRKRLVEVVSHTGGHLAANLGVVELTVALHRVYQPERDRIVFDVGHQCYCHKMLTGRDGAMDTLRSFGGLSGFPKPAESDCDAFIVGHASTSVSAAVGMARARSLQHEDYKVVALIGDGALTGGLAYEGLSDAGDSGEPMVVILNDNGMSITQSVGGVAEHLARQRIKPQYLRFKRGYRKLMTSFSLGRRIYRVTHRIKTAIKETLLPCSLFEDMGFTYLGPVDGHDVGKLTRLLSYAKDLPGPVLLHVRAVKGKGYFPAEDDPGRFHGVGKFDPKTGKSLEPSKPNFSKAFGDTLCTLAEHDECICAVTAAMQPGTGLDGFADRFPGRFFDVGIAEGHAVTMCAGMAKQGMIPVFAVYGTFLQRAYDMLLHDVALQKLHVVFCVDRAGLVGADGETHHSIFDVGFLDTVPGMTVLAPADFNDLSCMLDYAIHRLTGPVAIRYPRGGEAECPRLSSELTGGTIRPGTDLTAVSYGTQLAEVCRAAELLEHRGLSVEVVRLNRLSPLDPGPVLESVKKTGRLLVAEEASEANGVGQRLLAALAMGQIRTKTILLQNLGRGFPPQGSVDQLRRLYGLDAESLAEQAWKECRHGEEETGRPAL